MDQERDSANDPCMTNHTRRDPAQYLALLARRETERLTFAQLSEESGVPVATLQYWARKLREPEEQLTTAPADTPNAFLKVDLSPAPGSGIEVILDGDLRVAVNPGFDPATLRAVVDTLAC